jgi:hypothetical protein
MPSRERLDEFIAVVESGDHAGAIERYFTEDCRNGAATRYFASASSTIRPGHVMAARTLRWQSKHCAC